MSAELGVDANLLAMLASRGVHSPELGSEDGEGGEDTLFEAADLLGAGPHHVTQGTALPEPSAWNSDDADGGDDMTEGRGGAGLAALAEGGPRRVVGSTVGRHPSHPTATTATTAVDAPDHTALLIEADIANAHSALQRFLDANADGGGGQAGHRRGGSGDGDGGVGSGGRLVAAAGVASVSQERRREILAQLAAERSERRGFASARELVHLQAAAKTAPAGPPPAAAWRGGAAAPPPLPTAAAASASLPVAVAAAAQARPVPSSPVHASSVAGPPAQPALTSVVNTGNPARDALVNRLLAERRMKQQGAPGRTSGGGHAEGAVGSPTPAPRSVKGEAAAGPPARGSASTMPPPPGVATAQSTVGKGVTPPSAHVPAPSVPTPLPVPMEGGARPPTPELLRRLRAQVAARMGTATQPSGTTAAAPLTASTAMVGSSPHPASPPPTQPPSLIPRPSASSPRSAPAPSSTSALPHGAGSRRVGFVPPPRAPSPPVSHVTSPATQGTVSPHTAPVTRPPPRANCTMRSTSRSRGRSKGTHATGIHGAASGPLPTVQPPRSRSRSNSVAHASRLAQLARDKSHTYAVWEAERKAAEERRMAEECTFQPAVSGTKQGSGDPGVAASGGRGHRHHSASRPVRHMDATTPGGVDGDLPRRFSPPTTGRGGQGRAGASPHATHALHPVWSPSTGMAVGELEWEGSLAKRYISWQPAATATSTTATTTTATGVGSKAIPPPAGRAGRKASVSPPRVPTPGPTRTHTSPTPKPAASVSALNAASAADRLYAEAQKRHVARAKARAEAERKVLAECTFQPVTNAGTVTASSMAAAGLADPLPSQAAMSATAPARGGGESRPLYERSTELLRQKEAHLARLRMESEVAHPDLTFQPKINPRSAALAVHKMKQEGLPVAGEAYAYVAAGDIVPEEGAPPHSVAGDGGSVAGGVATSVAATSRLVKDAALAEARRAARMEAAAQAEAARHTFVPRIDPHAGDKVKRRLMALGVQESRISGMSFLQRQQLLHQLHQRKLATAAAAELERQGCTFAPDVGNADEVLALARPGHVLESAEERVHRLAVSEAARRRARKEASATAAVAGLTFKPRINPASAAMARAHTVEEHVKNEGAAKAKLAAAAAAEAEFRSQHPFAPQLIAAPPPTLVDGEGGAPLRLAAATDPSHLSERIEQYQREVAMKLEAARRLQEYEQLRECTFHPETNVGRSKPSGEGGDGGGGGDDVVVVRGLGRFLEMKELARKLDEDRRAREETAFVVKGVEPGHRGPTIPQPFHLATESGAMRRAASASRSKSPVRGEGGTSIPHASRAAKLSSLLDETLPGVDGRDEGAWMPLGATATSARSGGTSAPLAPAFMRGRPGGSAPRVA